MKSLLTLTLFTSLCAGLAAQAPGESAPAPAAAGPVIKWRGALWASGATSDRQTVDGSMFMRSVDSGNSFALDGLQLGADVALADGWAFKFTILAGQDAKILNAATLSSGSTPAETGSVAWPEAQISWTGGSDTLKFGRMYTPMGMEVMDQTQDTAASRGILFSYAVPFAQVGLNWHHAFTPSWSTDVWVYNGEDRIQDNNQSKTAGLGLTYNHGGAADKFVSLMAFSGAEQDGLGAKANTGAEGRKRNRVCMAGQWVWGKSTLQWDGEYARETFTGDALATASATATASWSGFGAIYKYQFNDLWSAYGRAEVLNDGAGVRLGADPTIAASYTPALGADLQARSFCLGAERRWHATFTRLEARRDNLNRDVKEGPAGNKAIFRNATSVTWSVGTSF